MSDAQISSDLAALGREDRATLFELDHVLRALPGEQPPLAVDEQLQRLPYAFAYARQMARAAWGATVLAIFIAWLGLKYSPLGSWLDEPFDYASKKSWTLATNVRDMIADSLQYVTPAFVVVVACAVAAIARRRAQRRVAVEPPDRLVERMRVPTLALEIAGATCVVAYFAVRLLAPDRPDAWWLWHGNSLDAPAVARVVCVTLALVACVTVPHRFEERLVAIVRHRATWLVALGLLYVTIDRRPLHVVGISRTSSVLAVVEIAAVFVVITTRALRGREVRR
jgi:hypothetical protein